MAMDGVTTMSTISMSMQWTMEDTSGMTHKAG